ncbi:HyaD/HybD family hydrogenase maturation endopeptidase [candidate division CSSED10-310 bacterium]|uniref:HyaD/HybD family hydrogenase maturation endopeptidase n=1 Tax=candidate division CSSED10-310 bacterium TaxID=2855610 RepID=A0ABV6Z0W3_UNCC1
MPKKIVILGVGNLLLSDEGVGVHVAQEMMNMTLPSGIEVVEGGTDGFGLIDIIRKTDRLVIIDAVKGGAQPGSIYRFDIDDVPDSPALFKTSVHQIGILEVIHISELIGKKPHTTIIGIEPASIEMGMELSPDIKALMSKIIELVLNEADPAHQ